MFALAVKAEELHDHFPCVCKGYMFRTAAGSNILLHSMFCASCGAYTAAVTKPVCYCEIKHPHRCQQSSHVLFLHTIMIHLASLSLRKTRAKLLHCWAAMYPAPFGSYSEHPCDLGRLNSWACWRIKSWRGYDPDKLLFSHLPAP